MRFRGSCSILAITACLLLVGCARRPGVIWSPAPVVQIIEPNGFRLVSLSFVPDAPLDDVILHVNPALRPYVTFSPSHLTRAEASLATHVRLFVGVPASIRPGRSIVGLVQIRAGRRTLTPVAIELQVVPSTPEGALESLRAAIVAREAAAYARQFVPDRQARGREVFEQLADAALDRLAEGLQSPNRVALSDDGLTAEFTISVRLEPHRTETTILLRRSVQDGIWRVERF